MSGRRQEILDAAFVIADEQGLDAVSMRAIADRVGVTPMALYRHYGSKSALLDGMVGHLLTALMPEAVSTGPWNERLGLIAHSYRGFAQQHPWAAQLLFSRPAITLDGIRLVEFIHQALREAGIPEHELTRMEHLVTTFVIGFAASEASGRLGPPDPGHTAEFEADLADLVRLIQNVATQNQDITSP